MNGLTRRDVLIERCPASSRLWGSSIGGLPCATLALGTGFHNDTIASIRLVVGLRSSKVYDLFL